MVLTTEVNAQIYEPEGLNMPGDWDSWSNPPTNLVLANASQTSGGLLIKQNNVVPRWTTTFEVAATGGDFVEGTYTWLFTSGPESNYFQNKWSAVTVVPDQVQIYTKEGADDNSITLENGYWYTLVWKDSGYSDTQGIFMKTSEEPVNIVNVTEPGDVNENEAVDVDFTLSETPCAEESFYLQYTTDGWATSSVINASISGTSGSGTIPGQAESTVVEYNVFSSSVSSVSTDGFVHALRINDNSELNYTYTVGTALADTIGWCNLQWPPNGEITPGGEFIVYGQVFIYNVTEQTNPVSGLEAWVGWSDTNSDPSTWTNWVSAPYLGNVGNNDEFSIDLGAEITTEGTYYYATRFKYLDQDYEYGGYSDEGGDFWDGVDYVSGVLTVTNNPNPDEISWCNLQYPASGEIEPLHEFLVYGQVYIDGITNSDNPVTDIQAWIGWSNSDSDPSTWTNWVSADFSSNQGNNDEYSANLGGEIDTEGTYYYATRFKYLDQAYVYGGHSDAGGGFWDGNNYVSGELLVTDDPTPVVIEWCNLQWPPNGEIEPQGEFFVYGQVYIDGVTNGNDEIPDLSAWIGVSSTDSDPSSWTSWYPMNFSSNIGNNDEYIIDLGEEMLNEGTFYYATRFQYQGQAYVYGGYNEDGGNFWDGTDYVSGVLTVDENPLGDTIGWANLQWPPVAEILPNEEFIVYGQVFIENVTSQFDSLTDLQAWVGINNENTDPSTWTNWMPAWYLQNDGNNDEYSSEIGSSMGTLGTYYYATRFKYEDQDYVYGGYSEEGGGFWDGVNNVNGMLTVTETPAPDSIGWCNLQWPPNGTIEPNSEYIVYAQAWIDGITSQADSLTDLQAWIGYSTTNTNPSEWTNWIPAWYSYGDGDNDEYIADLGAIMGSEGIFYYATRFKYQDQDYEYGGYSDNGGGFWDGVNNVNGILNVQDGPITYPVSFTVTDATALYSNIKFKGDMTGWNSLDMQQNGTDWSVSLDIAPGTYEWGVFEDDGSTNGIWLIIGENLVVAIDDQGNVTGDTTYTITFVGLEELHSYINVFPNPVTDHLKIKHTTEGIMTIRLLDVSGKLIKEEVSADNQILIEMQEFTKGIYFLEISENDRSFRTKIIKQ